ncbi:hypothetical protein FISHEDRAFT_70102 [Fistulina hepatica ATCC 64428]|uniref:Uncharacterized protein n=1 Tax=Fistulina hepatica ATCC 64428 TaxID=1128425 RepID=A0A0D7AK50_9AGAR|nr:hypothetical protein FISHEDRAFT_70102 [Fistulina hepatica ATCC 64428]
MALPLSWLAHILAASLFLAIVAHAQTETLVVGGNTVVVEITTDAQGKDVTETQCVRWISFVECSDDKAFCLASQQLCHPIRSIFFSGPHFAALSDTLAATTKAATTTTTTTQQQGVVGEEPTTTTGEVGGPTPYTYTTVIDGITTAILATFTPTNPTTAPITYTTTGSVMGIGYYKSVYGTTTSGTETQFVSSPILWGCVVSALAVLLC